MSPLPRGLSFHDAPLTVLHIWSDIWLKCSVLLLALARCPVVPCCGPQYSQAPYAPPSPSPSLSPARPHVPRCGQQQQQQQHVSRCGQQQQQAASASPPGSTPDPEACHSSPKRPRRDTLPVRPTMAAVGAVAGPQQQQQPDLGQQQQPAVGRDVGARVGLGVGGSPGPGAAWPSVASSSCATIPDPPHSTSTPPSQVPPPPHLISQQPACTPGVSPLAAGAVAAGCSSGDDLQPSRPDSPSSSSSGGLDDVAPALRPLYRQARYRAPPALHDSLCPHCPCLVPR